MAEKTEYAELTVDEAADLMAIPVLSDEALVRAATPMFFGSPKVGVTPGVPPPAHRIPTGSNEIPMTINR